MNISGVISFQTAVRDRPLLIERRVLNFITRNLLRLSSLNSVHLLPVMSRMSVKNYRFTTFIDSELRNLK
jgi:hypothetical protein